MSSIRAYRFALRCKPAQERQLARWSGQLRWLWNEALKEQRARHARGEKYAGFAAMCLWLTAWRNAPGTAWLAEGPVHPQQQVLRRLDEAYKRFFEAARAGQAGGRGRTGPPEFKRYGDNPGIRFPDPKQFSLDQETQRLKLPKLGWARMRLSQGVQGVLRNVSISKEGAGKHARWFVSLQVERSETIEALDVLPTLGIDVGLAAFAAFSSEVACPAGYGNAPKALQTMVEPLKAMERQQARLRRYQRSVARKKKGSANRKKAVHKLGALHRKIARQRSDWLHKLTTSLADAHPVIAIEDLKIRNMSASAAGTIEAPGKNVKAKAGLNRGILDAAWGEHARQLEYKLAWRGGRLVAVNPAYSSRTCRVCEHKSAENRRSQSLFSCVACGHTENADVHAAKVILARALAMATAERTGVESTDMQSTTAAGHAASACGGAVRRGQRASAGRAAPSKQEPTEAKALG